MRPPPSIALALRLLGLMLLALGFLMPGHFLPWLTFQGQWVAAAGATLIALGAALLPVARAGETTAQLHPLALLALLSAAVPALQWLAGQLSFHSDALMPSAYWLGFALAVVAGAAWTRADRTAWVGLLFLGLGLSAALSVGVALMQWLALEGLGLWVASLPPGARAFANLGQANLLATLLSLGVVATLLARARGRLGGVTTSVVLAWLGLGLVMTQSRIGVLQVAVIALWGLLMARRAGLVLTVPGVLLALLLFGLGHLAWGPLNDLLLLKPDHSMASRLEAGPRPQMWSAMADAITRAPWAGYGFNQIIIGQQTVALDHPPLRVMLESAHSWPLDMALSAGVVFAIVWCGAVALWLWGRVRRCRDREEWALLAAVGVLLLHALVEFPLEQAGFMLALALVIGSLGSTHGLRPGPRWRAVYAASVLGTAALLIVVGEEYLRVEQANQNARLALFGVGRTTAAEAAVPEVRWLDAPREYHRLMLTPAREGMSADELEWMRRVTRRHAFPAAMLRFALAAGLNGQVDEARLTLARLCAMHAPARCDDARASWRAASIRWPHLRSAQPP